MRSLFDRFLVIFAKAAIASGRRGGSCAAAALDGLCGGAERAKCPLGFRADAVATMLALLLAAAPAMGAVSARPVFPLGSYIGLVPPAGMKPSKTFSGFEDAANHAAIIVRAQPPQTFAAMVKTSSPADLKKLGITVEKREPFKLAIGKGLLIVGTQAGPDKTPDRIWLLAAGTEHLTAIVKVQEPEHSHAYTDAAVRAALATLALRDHVPQSELLKLLPFTVGNLAGYRIAGIRGPALILVDGPEHPHLIATGGIPRYDVSLKARAFIVALRGGPATDESRAQFARMAFDRIGGLRNVQITMSEPVKLNNQKAFETVAHAKESHGGNDVMAVQWLLFGHGAFLQIVGISRADVWTSELARLRTLRDSIEIK